MDNSKTNDRTKSIDCRVCLASIVTIHSPLVLILGAAAVLF